MRLQRARALHDLATRPRRPRVRPPRLGEKRAAPPPPPPEPTWEVLSDRWGPAVRLGAPLRVQAVAGYRAAVITLRPGLHLVAEVPDAVASPDFGLAPLLAPLLVSAARKALQALPRHPHEDDDAEVLEVEPVAGLLRGPR